MKKNLFTLLTFSVLLAYTSCNRDDGSSIGISPCNLRTEKQEIEVSNFSTRLFTNHTFSDSGEATYVDYNPTTGTAVLTIAYDGADARNGASFFEICNFPAYARVWKIPSEGLEVILNGSVYQTDKDHGPQLAIYSFFYLELKSLKRK